MRAFACGHCGQLVFFENSLCLRCKTALGFVPSQMKLLALEPGVAEAAGLRTCANLARAGCNWMVEAGAAGPLCRSCALTRTRPGDVDKDGLTAFATAEHAKRRLLFQLLSIGLPLEADGLQFDLLSSRSGPVVTGHEDGLITIDLAESDDVNREERRAEFDEPYRTMLGHFRHEIGHYYWPRLVEGQHDVDSLPGAVRGRTARLRGGAAALLPGDARRLAPAPCQRLRDDASLGGLGRDASPTTCTSATRSRRQPPTG